MAQYSPDFLASLKHRYEKTEQPMIELAREFGIGITTLQSLVDKQGWEKRSQRLRGLPGAMRLEREAEALAAALPSPSPERVAPIATNEIESEQPRATCAAASASAPPAPSVPRRRWPA